jgi:hypothetical protein
VTGFGHRLYALRHERGLSLRDLRAEHSISQDVMAAFLAGSRPARRMSRPTLRIAYLAPKTKGGEQ